MQLLAKSLPATTTKMHAPRATVRTLSQSATHGHVNLGPVIFRCALGRTGKRSMKREGDGATPIGSYTIDALLYRADRSRRIKTSLPAIPIQPHDGWCDAADDRNYNRRVRHPYPASAERLWRTDDLYDLVLVIGHNRHPRHRFRGSAIFIHVARPGYAPTEGCIALSADDLRKFLTVLRKRTRLQI